MCIFSINCVNVWCRWVILLCMIINWLLVSFIDVLKFRFLFKFFVILMWFFILKLNWGILFYIRIFWFLVLFFFIGMFLCGKLGIFSVSLLMLVNKVLSFVFVVFNCLFKFDILVSNGVMFCFWFFVLLMDLFCVLCLFCSFCVFICRVLCFFLRVLKVLIFNLKLWLVRCLVVELMLLCKYFGFNMWVFLFFG